MALSTLPIRDDHAIHVVINSRAVALRTIPIRSRAMRAAEKNKEAPKENRNHAEEELTVHEATEAVVKRRTIMITSLEMGTVNKMVDSNNHHSNKAISKTIKNVRDDQEDQEESTAIAVTRVEAITVIKMVIVSHSNNKNLDHLKEILNKAMVKVTMDKAIELDHSDHA